MRFDVRVGDGKTLGPITLQIPMYNRTLQCGSFLGLACFLRLEFSLGSSCVSPLSSKSPWRTIWQLNTPVEPPPPGAAVRDLRERVFRVFGFVLFVLQMLGFRVLFEMLYPQGLLNRKNPSRRDEVP